MYIEGGWVGGQERRRRRRRRRRMKTTRRVLLRGITFVGMGMGMGMEGKAEKKLLVREDFHCKGASRRERMREFGARQYFIQVILEKYEKRKRDGKHLTPSLAPSSYPRRPRSVRRRNPAGWYLWSESVGESPARAEEETASRPQKKPRREEEEEDHPAGPSASQRPRPRPMREEEEEDHPARPLAPASQRPRPRPRPRPRRDPEPFHPEDMPRELRDWIERQLQGTNFLPVCQKKLTTTDVNPHHRRLLIPMDRMVSVDFLTEDERARVDLPSTKGDERGIEVGVMSPTQKLRKLSFRKWVMNKGGGQAATVMYVLTKSDWAEVVKDFRLTLGDVIQIWSYRVDGELHMAVVVVNRAAQPQEGGN